MNLPIHAYRTHVQVMSVAPVVRQVKALHARRGVRAPHGRGLVLGPAELREERAAERPARGGRRGARPRYAT